MIITYIVKIIILTYIVCHGTGGNTLPEALQNIAHTPQQGIQVAVVEVD